MSYHLIHNYQSFNGRTPSIADSVDEGKRILSQYAKFYWIDSDDGVFGYESLDDMRADQTGEKADARIQPIVS